MANRGVNKVILVGNLGADPDIRYLPSGGMVTALRLATGEVWTVNSRSVSNGIGWCFIAAWLKLLLSF